MKEQFDKDLAKKIRDSFENHEETYDPKAWERLSKAYFKPKKSAWGILWPYITTGLAASLFLAVMFWPESVEDATTSTQITDASQPFSTRPDKIDSSINQDRNLPQKNDFAIEENKQTSPEGDSIRDSERKNTSSLPSEHPVTKDAGIESGPGIDDITHPKEVDTPLSPMEPKAIDQSAYITESKELFPSLAPPIDTLSSEKHHKTLMEQEDALEMLENWKNLAEDNSSKEKTKEPLPFKLGFLVAPQSSSNPVAGMNLGAGLMSEFSLSKKIKLDVGVTYARQSMSPENQQAMPQTMDMAMARSNYNFINSSYQLDFASLDIPVNLKYQVMETKNSGFYLITGLSSMVYLNQQATESFQTNSFFTTEADGILSFSPSVQQFSTVITPEGGENNMDLGRMVNLSVGYEYNLSNGMFISFEPFYKLPIGSLTFANQQFSIGGLNLRMNFKMGK